METCEIVTKVQMLLLTHPLFNRCVDNDRTLSVCVVGDTEYAEVFVDYVLQTGQMVDKRLIINWYIFNPLKRDEYLSARPALGEFVDTDGCLKGHGKALYGSIVFRDAAQYPDNFSGECRYIFAATDNDANNLETAEYFKKIVNEDCLAAYVTDGNIEVSYGSDTKTGEIAEAIDSVNLISSGDELERMAFNTHRIWSGSGNLDYNDLVKTFNDPYNHNSSLAFALSIPYKLRSVGIFDTDPSDAAAHLADILNAAKTDSQSREAAILTKLGELEHRRWVLEKVTQGAVGFISGSEGPDYLSCVRCGKIKEQDEQGRLHRHPCIARSDGKSSLSGHGYDRKKWDRQTEADAKLDDLDRMSVQLHRVMSSSARSVCADRKQIEADLAKLEKCFEGESASLREMASRYTFCIKNILDHSVPYSSQYGTYRDMLLKKVDKLQDGGKRDAVCAEVKRISRLLFPVIESNLYRDYKQYDVELVTYLPYILTGLTNIHICMPFGAAISNKNNNDEFFRSVASATALYAERITYFFVPEYNTNADVFLSKIRAIRGYFESRNKDCDIFIQILQPEDYPAKIAKSLKLMLDEAKGGRRYINGYDIKTFTNTDGLIGLMQSCVTKANADYYDGTDMLVSSPGVNGRVVSAVSQIIPYFEFESYNKRFVNCVDCDYLNYTRISTFIQVEDMFALMNAKDATFTYRDYAKTYMKFWDIYSGKNIPDSKFSVCASCWSRISEIVREGGSKSLMLDADENRTLKSMLSELEERKFISGLKYSGIRMQSDGKGEKYQVFVALKTLDNDLRELCSAAGELLEVYVFFKALETGWFDDIQTGYKFKWEGGKLNNELDCVLTKGYRSLVVECKSVKKAEEDYFLILDSLGDHFGIGYKKVLIMVTDMDGESYKSCVERGKLMDVFIFSSRDDLENIGLRLKQLMEK